ncbi:T-lymphocyte surface antigen Ly-9-like isoform X2 [Elgaria multicarinata webbii]|uniref:T-lymphocyte surface antigen Ly-9-like isoform X2 n=1 Tax=Elgaria multicarinata webbii TaxID=159646 RepID=UPI002FCD02A5
MCNQAAMINRNIFHVFFIVFLKMETSGEETAEEARGVLGGSVTFQLKPAEQFRGIFWLTNSRSDSFDTFAVLSPRKPCELQLLLPTFLGRLNVSEDCKRLQVSHLVQDDSGTYRAQIQRSPEEEPLRVTFGLQVYKLLTEADLTVRCDRGGNGTLLQLNCSTGPLEDGVEFSWNSISEGDLSSSGRSLSIWYNSEDPDRNITCTAQNPVGSASKTVSLKQCWNAQAEQPVKTPETQPTPDNGMNSGHLSEATIAGIAISATAAIITGIVAIALCLRQKKKGGAHVSNQGSAGNSEPKDCTTVYALVGNASEPTSTQKTKQRREPTKLNKDLSHTVYTAVHLPKPNSLETDDEKMQKEGQGGAMKDSDKTVYSEIKLQENEDEHIKTVYETVNCPKLPKAQEYNDII